MMSENRRMASFPLAGRIWIWLSLALVSFNFIMAGLAVFANVVSWLDYLVPFSAFFVILASSMAVGYSSGKTEASRLRWLAIASLVLSLLFLLLSCGWALHSIELVCQQSPADCG